MSILKVLLATRPLVPPWDEASKNFAYFLAKNIQHPDIEIHVLTTSQKLAGLGERVVAHPLYASEADKREANSSWMQKVRLPFYLFFQSFRYDIVHYLFTPTTLNSMILKYFTPFRPKTIQTVATVREDLYTPMQLKKLFFAHRLITYTERTQKKLVALGFTNVTRIYPGIDLDLYQPQGKDAEILAAHSLTPDDFLVIYPGEYTRLGATDMLAETFIEYCTAHPDSNIKFFFTCRIKNEADRAKREKLRLLVKEHGLEKSILFEENPKKTDMTALYNTADVVIFPVHDLKGKFDVPLVIIESYACAKPVILSDLAEFQEFANEKICVTIPKGSKEKLIESLLYLKDNPLERARLGENARRFVKDHFDLKNTAKQYEDIYTSL